MEEFRTALQELTVSPTDDDPQKIIIIIDELDRCRPDYALSMLEVIKHFFAVDNVHFVLGVNLKELENSVKARYGGGIDAESYLQKFIHLRLTLPIKIITGPDFGDVAIEYLSKVADELSLPKDLVETTQYYLRIAQNKLPLSLRSIERLSTILALLPRNLENKVPGYKYVITGAAIVKSYSPTLYSRLLDGKATMEKIDQFFDFSSTRPETDGAAKVFRDSWLAFIDPEAFKNDTQISQDLFHGSSYGTDSGWLYRTLNNHLETFDLLDSHN